jgi:hypothetical protein
MGASRSLGSLEGGEDLQHTSKRGCGWPFLYPGIVPGSINEGRDPWAGHCEAGFSDT